MNTHYQSRRSDKVLAGKDPAHVYEPDPHEPLTKSIVTAVRTVSDRETDELPPLYTVVDPDALNNLFRPPRKTPTRDRNGSVIFEYTAFWVHVASDHTVTIFHAE